jgi:hypothetical protein
MPLSGPEQCAERMLQKRIVAELRRCGACIRCVHRDRDVIGWGRSVCGTEGRTFPVCVRDGGAPGFELDESTLRGEHEE